MSKRLDGKVAVITGGARGIGRGVVLRFLAEGARVVVADIDEAGAAELQREAGAGGRLHCVRADVTVEVDIEAAVAAATERFGRLDCVLSNAGAAGALQPLAEMTVADWDATMALLLRSVMLGLKHGARALQAQGQGGVLLATASSSAHAGGCAPTAYATAKAGIVNLVKHAALELATHRIRVNSISPGAIYTPAFAAGGTLPEQLAALQPWPQAGTPEDVASVAVFLASDDSTFVTGSDYAVDGGIVAMGPHLLQRLYGRGTLG